LVPKEEGGLSGMWNTMIDMIEGNGGVLDSLLITDSKGNINHMAMIVMIGVPIIMMFCICYVVIDSEPEEIDAKNPKHVGVG
jgi:hypothetical protein